MIELKFEPFIPDSVSPTPPENAVSSNGNEVVSDGNIVVSSKD